MEEMKRKNDELTAKNRVRKVFVQYWALSHVLIVLLVVIQRAQEDEAAYKAREAEIYAQENDQHKKEGERVAAEHAKRRQKQEEARKAQADIEYVWSSFVDSHPRSSF